SSIFRAVRNRVAAATSKSSSQAVSGVGDTSSDDKDLFNRCAQTYSSELAPSPNEVAIAIQAYRPAPSNEGSSFEIGEVFILEGSDAQGNVWCVKREGTHVIHQNIFPSEYLVKESELVDFKLITFDVKKEEVEKQLSN
ncbi:hypothetical protein PMAYCL1PPCAC_09243, partial [Pristionchus mayeri]